MKKELTKTLFALLLLPSVISVSACASKKDEPVVPPEPDTPVTPDEPVDPEPQPEPEDDKPKASLTTNYFVERTTKWFPYEFNIENFLEIGDEPNSEVLKTSLLLESNISMGAKVNFNKTDYPTTGYYDNENIYKHFDLDGFEKIDIVASEEIDKDDITFLNIAHKKHEDKEICFVTIEDSGVSTSWSSNFDVGVDDDVYYDKTGEHPEWTNKKNHKGFDVTSNRIVSIIKDYQNRILDENSQQIFYIFGHSRGGALANIVGSKLIDLEYKVTSYGMASPMVTTSEDADDPKYNHLYSFVNNNDIITTVLTPKWGFKRYGKTIDFSIQELKDEFKTFNNFDLPKEPSLNMSEVLQKMCDGRKEIYEFSDDFIVETSEPMPSEDVEAYIEELLKPLSDKFESLKPFLEIKQNHNDDETVTVVTRSCPAFLISVLGLVMSSLDETPSGASLIASLINLVKFVNPFLTKAGMKLTDLMGLDATYLILCHTFTSYGTYVNYVSNVSNKTNK